MHGDALLYHWDGTYTIGGVEMSNFVVSLSVTVEETSAGGTTFRGGVTRARHSDGSA
jgi:hypothetical protein